MCGAISLLRVRVACLSPSPATDLMHFQTTILSIPKSDGLLSAAAGQTLSKKTVTREAHVALAFRRTRKSNVIAEQLKEQAVHC